MTSGRIRMRKLSLKRIRGLLLVAFVLAFAPALLSSAAVKPGFVETVIATDVTGTRATLTWTRAKNATGYNVYLVDSETSEIIGGKPIATTTDCRCVVALRPGRMFSFQIFAYLQNGRKTVENEEGSPPVDVEPQTLRVLCYGNGYAYLEWDETEKADGYILYRYNKKKGKYKKLQTLQDTSCLVSIPEGESYKYMLRSYRIKKGKRVLSTKSNELKVKGKKLEVVHGRLWQAWLNRDVIAKDKETGENVALKKGTRVLVAYHASGPIDATLLFSGGQQGSTYTVNGSYLNYGELYLAPSYTYYSKNQAESFINCGGYTSKTNYLIWISQYTGSVHFFVGSQRRWKEQRVAQCIIGGPMGHTAVGQYELLDRGDPAHIYFYWNPYKEWGQAFHGYLDRNTWGALSYGCVRLSAADFAYLKRLPYGTKVVSY